MKKAARTAKRALISRAQQIFSIRRRLAFLRELERRLKEQTASLDAYKPVRSSPSRLPELSDSQPHIPGEFHSGDIGGR